MAPEQKRTRLYSRRGDLGETSLLFGPRVGKDHRRIELLGVLEELSVQLGQVRALEVEPEIDRAMCRLIFRVHEVSAEIACVAPSKFSVKIVDESDIKAVERVIDCWDAKLEPIRGALMPGGAKSSIAIQQARIICRRAERRACALLRFDPSFSPRVGAWLNRVSDMLYVFARYENVRQGVHEVLIHEEPGDSDLF